MNKRISSAVVAGLLALPVVGVQALPFLPDFAVGATGGTAGLGVQLTTQVIPFVNARVQVQGLSFSHSINEDGIDYDGKLELFSGGAFVDVYPFLKGPRLSAGLVGNGNKVRLNATCPNTCNVGELQVSGSNGRVNGNLDFNGVAPYLGFGFTNPMGGLPLYIGFDAGVLFQGRPKANLSAAGTATVTDSSGVTRTDVNLATDPEVQSALAVEEANLTDDVKDFRFYPVVQVNIGWRF